MRNKDGAPAEEVNPHFWQKRPEMGHPGDGQSLP